MWDVLDRLYARRANPRPVFAQGWGSAEVLERAGTWFPSLVPVDVHWGRGGFGSFLSPYARWLPEESRLVHLERLMPSGASLRTPVVLLLASTGDAGFAFRRRWLAAPLLRAGVGVVLLEQPFYGLRRPLRQHTTCLDTVSDLWAMGMAVWEEGRAVLDALRREGFTRLGVAGISLGGHLASHVAALFDGPLAVASLVSPHSGEVVFVDGALRPYLHPSLDPEELRRVLEPSDLRRFPRPPRPDACFRVGAWRDAYVAPHSVEISWRAWPGSQLRWVRSGHVVTVGWRGAELVRAVLDAFERLLDG